MTGRLHAASLAILLPVFMLPAGACQTMSDPVPAVLMQSDADTMSRLKAALARATGQAQVTLGPGDLTQTSVVSVLPRPPSSYEDRSLAKPTLFRIEIVGQTCSLIREDNNTRTALEGVQCRAAN